MPCLAESVFAAAAVEAKGPLDGNRICPTAFDVRGPIITISNHARNATRGSASAQGLLRRNDEEGSRVPQFMHDGGESMRMGRLSHRTAIISPLWCQNFAPDLLVKMMKATGPVKDEL